MAGHDLPERLGSWVDAGLITEDQADAIRAHEAEPPDRAPAWVEPVAYLGAVLVGVALFLFGLEVWDRLAPWGRLTLALLVTVVLVGTGVFLRRSDSGAARRAASFSWFLGLAGVLASSALAVYDVLDVQEEWAVVIVAGVTLVASIGLYVAARTGLQQVAMGLATAFMVVSLMAVLPISPPWIAGLLLAGAGAGWLLLTWGGILTPEPVGWVLGSLLVLGIGFGTVDDGSAWWAGAGLVVALALIWLSTRIDLRSVLAVGAVGLLVWIPTTVVTLFEDSIAVPVAILVTGVVTLTAVVIGVRSTDGGAADAN